MKKGDIFWLAVILFLLILFSQKFNKQNAVDKAFKRRIRMKNEDYLLQLNPAVADKFRAFINDISALGYIAVIDDGYRSFQQQAIEKKADIRNATPGFSAHNYGIGIDLYLTKDGKIVTYKSSPVAVWNKTGVPQLAKQKYGMRWGGDFWGYSDPVHFDYENVYNTKVLYSMAMKRWGTPQAAIGNKLDLSQYPKA